MKKICFVVNVDWFFVSHRMSHALALQKQGYEIILISNIQHSKDILIKNNISFFHLPFERSGTNVTKELSIIIRLFCLYLRIKPFAIHHVTIKPVLYGNIVSAFIPKKIKIINAISGLGYNFIDNRTSFSIKLLKVLMKIFLRGNKKHFIFQNKDDLTLFKQLKLVSNNFTIIKGSGVDSTKFRFIPTKKKTKLKILFPARLLKDKGLFEFVESAKLLYPKYKNKIVFQIMGDIDLGNNASISNSALQKIVIPNYLEWIGFQTNVIPFYRQSDIVCLPSYREGLPKSLVEAMAIGRPIVTTEAPGCKDCVIDGYNGFKVPVKNTVMLAQKIEELIQSESLRKEMGQNSRTKFELEFSLDIIIAQTVDLYKSFE